MGDRGRARAARQVRPRRRARGPTGALLSMGERTRALMALFQGRHINTLVLDEPTNHLDVEAIEQLGEPPWRPSRGRCSWSVTTRACSAAYGSLTGGTSITGT